MELSVKFFEMRKTINILVVLGIAPLFLLGAVNVIAPSNTFDLYGIKPLSIMTYSTFRGAIGGLLIGGGLLMLMGLITKNKLGINLPYFLYLQYSLADL
jgi:hypothetical protein